MTGRPDQAEAAVAAVNQQIEEASADAVELSVAEIVDRALGRR